MNHDSLRPSQVGFSDSIKEIEVYKTMDSILAGEARQFVVLVLPDAVVDVIRDSDVKDT